MRKIIASMNITLDGFIAGSNGELDWHFTNWSIDMSDALTEQLSKADTILLGANTYRVMAGYWPSANVNLCFPRVDMAYAEMMNSYRKVVCSKTVNSLHWNNSIQIKDNTLKAITQLKQQPGKEIMIYGSGKLVSSLLQNNLIDQCMLWVHPVILGNGRPLFGTIKKHIKTRLAGVRSFNSGVVIIQYDIDHSRG
jgi:dihydrofolate reductase